jgi:hypothetical protein
MALTDDGLPQVPKALEANNHVPESELQQKNRKRLRNQVKYLECQNFLVADRTRLSETSRQEESIPSF